jgi:hypothetical protein
VRRGWRVKGTLAILVAAGLLMGAAAEACEIVAGAAPRGRLEAADIVVVFDTRPPVIEVGRPFAVAVRVCADGTLPTLARVDADMPAHLHGMNYRPTLAVKGDGLYAAEGLLFHMPGRWRLHFDLERGDQRSRFTTDIVLE